MFEVPAWGKDIPISEVSFGKKVNNNSTKNTETVQKDTAHHGSKVIANGVKKAKHKNKGNVHNSYKDIPESVHSSKFKSNLTNKNSFVNGVNKAHTNKNKLNRKFTNTGQPEHSLPPTNFATNRLKSAINNRKSVSIQQTTHPVNGGNTQSRQQKINPSANSHKTIKNKSKSVANSRAQITKTDTTISPINGVNNKQSKKRKHDSEMVNANKNSIPNFEDTFEEANFDNDLLDEVIINAKKKKLNEEFKNDDREDVLFGENCKKERIRKLLQESNRNSINTNGNKLRERMMERLKAAQFRYINEKLYTSSGSDAQKLFDEDPAAFETYHEGYQQQVKKWPVNPLDYIVKRVQKMPVSYTIADMGCGEAALARRVRARVRSFDLRARTPGVEACDMAHTPLLAASVDATVYCLALMGTDLTRYLLEANRVLKIGGHLLIAEVESRFDKVENFTKDVERLGFKMKNLDKSNKMFFFMEFTKIRESPVKKSKLPVLSLKPCLYKKR